MSSAAVATSVGGERLARVAPLGVRFWDAATSRFVSEGLVVSHTDISGRRRTAVVNHASVFVFADLPGLRDLELGDHGSLARTRPGDDDYWRIVPALARRYAIEVVELLGRFIPFRFEAVAPFRGLFELSCGSPPSSPPASGIEAVPLFSAPARTPVPGAGVVRAQLSEPSQAPAAWAMLEVSAAGAPAARGLADGQGRVAVIVPYPEPSASAGSPPSGRTRPLAEERWEVGVRCFYDRSVPADAPPDICRVLAQAPAELDLDLSPPQSLELDFGRDLVIATPGRSEAIVTPAASPP